MRLSIYFLTLVFLSSCTTIEVGREVAKVGAVVKDKVEETIIKKNQKLLKIKLLLKNNKLSLKKKKRKKL